MTNGPISITTITGGDDEESSEWIFRNGSITITLPVDFCQDKDDPKLDLEEVLKELNTDSCYDGRYDFHEEMIEHALNNMIKYATFKALVKHYEDKYPNEFVETSRRSKSRKSNVLAGEVCNNYSGNVRLYHTSDDRQKKFDFNMKEDQ